MRISTRSRFVHILVYVAKISEVKSVGLRVFLSAFKNMEKFFSNRIVLGISWRTKKFNALRCILAIDVELTECEMIYVGQDGFFASPNCPEGCSVCDEADYCYFWYFFFVASSLSDSYFLGW